MPETARQPGCAPAHPAERRAWVRYQCDLRCYYQFVSVGQAALWPGRVLNLSARGLALGLTYPVEPGAFLEVSVEGPRGLSRTLIGRVVYCTPEGGGEWVAGCELTEELSCQALLDLLL